MSKNNTNSSDVVTVQQSVSGSFGYSSVPIPGTTSTYRLTRFNNQCTLFYSGIPQGTATVTSTVVSDVFIPADMRPSDNQVWVIRVQNAGTFTTAMLRVDSAGSIFVGTLAGGTFTGSGNFLITRGNFVWLL